MWVSKFLNDKVIKIDVRDIVLKYWLIKQLVQRVSKLSLLFALFHFINWLLMGGGSGSSFEYDVETCFLRAWRFWFKKHIFLLSTIYVSEIWYIFQTCSRFFGTSSLSTLKNLSSLWSCPTMGCSKRVLVFLSTALQGNFSLRWAGHIKKQKHHVCSQSFTYSAYIKKADNSINKFPELFKGIKGPSPWRWFSICQEGWNSYGQVKLQRISEGLKLSLSLPRFGWFYKRNGTTWSDGRVGPKNGVFLEVLQYPGHNGNWQ